MKEAAKAVMPKACSPCYECPDRAFCCWATCERYKQFKEERIEICKAIKEKARTDRAPEVVVINGVQRRRQQYSGKKPPIR